MIMLFPSIIKEKSVWRTMKQILFTMAPSYYLLPVIINEYPPKVHVYSLDLGPPSLWFIW